MRSSYLPNPSHVHYPQCNLTINSSVWGRRRRVEPLAHMFHSQACDLKPQMTPTQVSAVSSVYRILPGYIRRCRRRHTVIFFPSFFPLSSCVLQRFLCFLQELHQQKLLSPTEKNCSLNASSVVPPLIMWLCDVKHLNDLSQTASLAHMNYLSCSVVITGAGSGSAGSAISW